MRAFQAFFQTTKIVSINSMINLKSHFIVVLIIGFVAYQPTVLADNIFSVFRR